MPSMIDCQIPGDSDLHDDRSNSTGVFAKELFQPGSQQRFLRSSHPSVEGWHIVTHIGKSVGKYGENAIYIGSVVSLPEFGLRRVDSVSIVIDSLLRFRRDRNKRWTLSHFSPFGSHTFVRPFSAGRWSFSMPGWVIPTQIIKTGPKEVASAHQR